MATEARYEMYGDSPNGGGPPGWTKGAAAGLAGTGALLVLGRRRRRRKAAAKAKELESAASNRARSALRMVQNAAAAAPTLAKSAAAAAPELAKSLPDRTKPLASKAGDFSSTARSGVTSWRKDLNEGKWQAWAALLAGIWVLMRLAERRQTKRLTRALASARA